MKFTKKEIREHVATIRGTDTTSTDAQILYADATAALATFKAYCGEASRTPEEVTAALVPVRTAVEWYNCQMRCDRLDTLSTMKPQEAVADYVRTQCVTGLKIATEKETGYKIEESKTVELDAYDFVETICSADLNGILDACCIFADNVARYDTRDDGAHVSKKSASETYVSLRKRKGWDVEAKDLNLTILAQQLTELANMISFGSLNIRMQSTDVKFIRLAVFQGKSKADCAGAVQIRDEKTIIRFVFRAMYTRFNSKPYEWQTQTNVTGEARVSKPNKAMSESTQTKEFKKEADPQAGPVTTGKAPKKGSKKSTKKEEAAE